MIRRQLEHLLKTAARAFVVEVVERFVAFGAQGIESCPLVLAQSGNERKDDYEDWSKSSHVPLCSFWSSLRLCVKTIFTQKTQRLRKGRKRKLYEVTVI
jgi:hypothetical protein